MGFSFDLDNVVRAERRRQWGQRRANIETSGIFQTLLEACGIQGLVNETIVFECGSDRLMVTGVDDVHMFYTPAALAEMKRPRTFGPGTFAIALVHSPEFATVASDNGYHLCLTGHTHGGQICLPGGMPLVTALLTHRKLARRGLWRNGGMSGFTSAGAGVSAIRVRYFSQGEVTILTLRRAGE